MLNYQQLFKSLDIKQLRFFGILEWLFLWHLRFTISRYNFQYIEVCAVIALYLHNIMQESHRRPSKTRKIRRGGQE